MRITKKYLLKRIEELETKLITVVKDHHTGFYINECDAVSIPVEHIYSYYSLYGSIHTSKRWFKRGTQPKVDLIKIAADGKETYIKNNVACDKHGKILK